LRKEPTANEGTSDSDEKVADNPEPGALHNLTGQPSGNEADHQYDQETFTRHVHLRILQLHQQADKFPPAHETRDPSAKTARPKANIRYFKEEGNHLFREYSPMPEVKTVQNCSLKRSADFYPHGRTSGKKT
jgi:hypothetical protein